ncbi:MAG: tryptophan-rich sensory protein [Arenicella sp.]|jgi:translocator protein|nr:tryptophan-rich sensory protein [Arenicella sp.]
MSNFDHPITKSPGLKLLICVFGCFATLSIGGLFQPGEWYQDLNRAPWNPPNIVFPIVWTTLYIMIALSGWIIAKSNQTTLIILWWVQLALNAAWSWLFFGEYWPGVALLDIILILGIVGALIKMCRAQPDLKTAGNLLIPYFAWLCVALSLNGHIWLYN